MEHILLSGDRLDVYFELNDGSKIAVEIKPSSSPDADVLRGLFQCVKYKAILDSEDKVHGKKATNSAILVIGGELSPENRKVQETLDIKIIEKCNLWVGLLLDRSPYVFDPLIVFEKILI